MTDSMTSPFEEGGPFWAGRNADGSFTALVQITFSVEDLIKLRAAALRDPDHFEVETSLSDIAVDLGDDAAVVPHLTDVLQTAAWQSSDLTDLSMSVRVGGSTAFVPREAF